MGQGFRLRGLRALFIVCAVIGSSITGLWALCNSTQETYAIHQCADLAYFGPLPPPYSVNDVAAVFWQIGFGNNLNNTGMGGAGTGMNGPSNFTGNDSGLLQVDILDANALDSRFPPGSICLGSNDWANSGVDGCCDNPRATSFTYGGYYYQGDDDILNP